MISLGTSWTSLLLKKHQRMIDSGSVTDSKTEYSFLKKFIVEVSPCKFTTTSKLLLEVAQKLISN